MSNVTATSPHPITPEMPAPVVSYLKAGGLGLVITVGDDGYPTDAFTWVVATGPKTLRFCADKGGKTLANLERDGRAAVQIVGPDNLVFLIKGTSRKIKDDLESVDMGIELWEMDVVGARDQSWPGAAPLPFAVQWYGDNRNDMVRSELAAYDEMVNA
jgi:hypothetical protein